MTIITAVTHSKLPYPDALGTSYALLPLGPACQSWAGPCGVRHRAQGLASRTPPRQAKPKRSMAVPLGPQGKPCASTPHAARALQKQTTSNSVMPAKGRGLWALNVMLYCPG